MSLNNTVKWQKRLLIFTVVILVITTYTFKRQKADPQKVCSFFCLCEMKKILLMSGVVGAAPGAFLDQ